MSEEEITIDLGINTFAAACFNMNSIDDLTSSLSEDADREDCRVWSITPQQWRASIAAALAAKLLARAEEG